MNDMERRIDRYYGSLYDKYNDCNGYEYETEEEEDKDQTIKNLKDIIDDLVWLAENENIEKIREYIKKEGLKG